MQSFYSEVAWFAQGQNHGDAFLQIIMKKKINLFEKKMDTSQ